jgi:hypothetical protein
VTVTTSLTSNRLLIPVALVVPFVACAVLAFQVGAALTEYGARGSQAP